MVYGQNNWYSGPLCYAHNSQDNKLYYSNLFNVINEIKNHRIDFHEEKYGEFLKRKFEILQQKKCKNEEVLNKLNNLDSNGIELSADKIVEYLVNGKV